MARQRQSYGIRQHSHYQDSTPGPVLAMYPLTPAGEAHADAQRLMLSTCSFCTPGSQLGNYQTGDCYEVVYSWRDVGYRNELGHDQA